MDGEATYSCSSGATRVLLPRGCTLFPLLRFLSHFFFVLTFSFSFSHLVGPTLCHSLALLNVQTCLESRLFFLSRSVYVAYDIHTPMRLFGRHEARWSSRRWKLMGRRQHSRSIAFDPDRPCPHRHRLLSFFPSPRSQFLSLSLSLPSSRSLSLFHLISLYKRKEISRWSVESYTYTNLRMCNCVCILIYGRLRVQWSDFRLPKLRI